MSGIDNSIICALSNRLSSAPWCHVFAYLLVKPCWTPPSLTLGLVIRYHKVNLIPSNSLTFPGLFKYYFIQGGLPLTHLVASTSVMEISRIIFLKRWVALITYLYEWIAFKYNTKDSEFKYEPHLTISPQLLGVPASLRTFWSTPSELLSAASL